MQAPQDPYNSKALQKFVGAYFLKFISMLYTKEVVNE